MVHMLTIVVILRVQTAVAMATNGSHVHIKAKGHPWSQEAGAIMLVFFNLVKNILSDDTKDEPQVATVYIMKL